MRAAAAATALFHTGCCCSSAISSSLDLSLRTLDGSHIRPMEQALVDLPPEVARVANQAAATGGTLLGGRGLLPAMLRALCDVQHQVLHELCAGSSNRRHTAGWDSPAASCAANVMCSIQSCCVQCRDRLLPVTDDVLTFIIMLLAVVFHSLRRPAS